MHLSNISYWLTNIETLEPRPKRKRSRSPSGCARFDLGLSSPPLSSMDSDQHRDDNLDDITPRPPRFTSPNKRQRTRANLPRDSPSRGSPRSTHSCNTSSTGDGKSTGPRSAIRDLNDLAIAGKPINFVKVKSELGLPVDVLDLLRKLKVARAGQNIIPNEVFTKFEIPVGVLETPISDNNTYDADVLKKDKDDQPTRWDATDEYNVLQRVTDHTEECEVENLSEPSWNARVHEPLLDMALSPFRRSVSHWDVTRANISKDYQIRGDTGQAFKSKMVDFVITLDSTEVVGAVKEHIRDQGGYFRSINHTEYGPLRYRPITISIETKATDGSSHDGTTQLAVWAGAHITLLKQLSETSNKAAAGVGIGVTLPLLLVRGSQWHLMLAVDRVTRMDLLDVGLIGDTSTLVGCYKMVAQLRRFVEWSTKIYQEWFLRDALS